MVLIAQPKTNKNTHLTIKNKAVTMGTSLWNVIFDVRHLVWQNWLQATTEIFEVIAAFVNLYPLTIILDFCIHAIWAFLHGIFH